MNLFINEIIAVFVLVVAGLWELTIFIEVLSSWFTNPWKKGRFRILIEDINRPLLGSVRKLVPAVGGIDFSPLIAIFILEIVPGLIIGLLGVDYRSLVDKLQT